MTKRICQYCDEEKTAFLLEGDSCVECAMDAELDEMLIAAANRAEELGVEFGRFFESARSRDGCCWTTGRLLRGGAVTHDSVD